MGRRDQRITERLQLEQRRATVFRCAVVFRMLKRMLAALATERMMRGARGWARLVSTTLAVDEQRARHARRVVLPDVHSIDSRRVLLDPSFRRGRAGRRETGPQVMQYGHGFVLENADAQMAAEVATGFTGYGSAGLSRCCESVVERACKTSGDGRAIRRRAARTEVPLCVFMRGRRRPVRALAGNLHRVRCESRLRCAGYFFGASCE